MCFLEWQSRGEVYRWGLEVVHKPKHTPRESPTAHTGCEQREHQEPYSQCTSAFRCSAGPATNWHWPSTSARTKSQSAMTADCQHPLKSVQGGDQERDTLCSGKDWQNRSSDRCVQDNISWAQFLYCLTFKILHGDICSLWLAVTFCENVCLIACAVLSPKSHVYWPDSGAISQTNLKRCLQGYIIILSQTELNSHLSHCAFVFSSWHQEALADIMCPILEVWER